MVENVLNIWAKLSKCICDGGQVSSSLKELFNFSILQCLKIFFHILDQNTTKTQPRNIYPLIVKNKNTRRWCEMFL